jgi:hypothetical protein
MNATDLDLTGRLINGRYYAKRPLPRRSFTVDWLARALASGTDALLKLLPRPDAELPAGGLARFRSEWSKLASLSDPHLEKTHEVGNHAGFTFLAAESIHGVVLQDYVQRSGPLAPAAGARVLLQAAKALEYVHQLGLVHKGLNPGNIWLIIHYDEIQDVKLADFCRVEYEYLLGGGRARLAKDEFLAPEVKRSAEAARAASDLYSLGMILTWLLTGRTPKAWPSSLARLPPVHPALLRVLQKAGSAEPSRRYPVAGEMVEDLVRFLQLPADQREGRMPVLPDELEPGLPPAPPRRRARPSTSKKRKAKGPVKSKKTGRVRAAAARRRISKKALHEVRERMRRLHAAQGKAIGWLQDIGAFKQLFRDVFDSKGGVHWIARDEESFYTEKLRILEYYRYYARYRGGAMLIIPANRAGERYFLLSRTLGLFRPRQGWLGSEEWPEALEAFRSRFRSYGRTVRGLHPHPEELWAKASRRKEAGGKAGPTAMAGLLWKLLSFYSRLRHPLIVVLREAQLLDPDSLRLLEGCRPRLRNAPILILGLFRSPGAPEGLRRQIRPRS